LHAPQKLAAAALIVALGATAYGIYLLGHASTVSAKKKAAASENALVDQTPFKTAQQLAQLADTPDEQELAKEVLRLSDYELDLSLAIALQEAEAHPPDLSAEAKEIQQRLQKDQKLQQALQTQVDQLIAQLAKATGSRKADLQDQLDMAKASLGVANNDVDDASRDLSEAGGNQRDRVEKMKESHEEADKARKDPEKIFPPPTEEKLGLIHGLRPAGGIQLLEKTTPISCMASPGTLLYFKKQRITIAVSVPADQLLRISARLTFQPQLVT